jgi:hypothetical protein
LKSFCFFIIFIPFYGSLSAQANNYVYWEDLSDSLQQILLHDQGINELAGNFYLSPQMKLDEVAYFELLQEISTPDDKRLPLYFELLNRICLKETGEKYFGTHVYLFNFMSNHTDYLFNYVLIHDPKGKILEYYTQTLSRGFIDMPFFYPNPGQFKKTLKKQLSPPKSEKAKLIGRMIKDIGSALKSQNDEKG